MSSTLEIGYTPTDFLWSSFEPISSTQCKDTKDIPCDGNNVSVECMKQILCENNKASNRLYSTENKHTGASTRYMDYSMKYNTLYLDTIHLGIGIMVFMVGGIIMIRQR